jgi:cytochrome c oxidase assembly protein subunit 11
MTAPSASATLRNRNRRVGLIALGAALAMIGVGFAAVPLYRIFCQVTGFGGTAMRVSEAQAATIQSTNKLMQIRFDANVVRGMPWQFKPVQVTDTVSVGVRDLAFYTAKNESNYPVTGTASFNVEPAQAAKYFSKIQCFCFTEQTLKPGEEIRMPVTYYVDPAILDDPDTKDIEEITLSYTFHLTAIETADGGAKALDRAETDG